jgi:GT2 family glycosyltransferase
MSFLSSQDARAVGAPIVCLLVCALDRIPRKDDLAPLVARFRAGESLADLAAAIAASDEFLARHGPAGPPDTHYATALYAAIDGQDPPADVATILALSGMSRARLLLEVSMSGRARSGVDLIANLYPGGLPPQDDVAYQLWLETYEHDAPDLAASVHSAAHLSAVRFAVFVRVPPIRPDLVGETIAALRAQIFPHWDCILLCAADLPARVRTMAEDMVARHAGVAIAEVADASAIAATVNTHLAGSDATMFAMIDAGDLLAPQALALAARDKTAHPDTVLIYTDEDRIDGDGTRRDPSFKPDFSLDLSFAGDMFGQLTLFDRAAALQAGALSAAAGPFMAYGLGLALAQRTGGRQLRHIPKILLHRGRLKTAQVPAFPALRATSESPALCDVVNRHLAACYPDLSLQETWHGHALWPAISAALPGDAPCVSIIIPMRDRPELMQRCLDGLLYGTDYPDIEILIVDNGSVEAPTLQFLQRVRHDPRVRVLTRPGAFNWSALNNHAASVARGQILLFLNNDIEIVQPGWLRIIAGHVMRADVGIVGARLVYPDGGLQHGGILLGPTAQAVHAYTYARDTDGYLGQVSLGRDLSAVSGACLAIRAEVLRAAGGFAEALAITWGDVELCLRVRASGLRVLWAADAVLVHHEMSTRGADTSPQAQIRHELERSIARRRHFTAMDHDPFLNPNLAATATTIVLASPPRHRTDAADVTAHG